MLRAVAKFGADAESRYVPALSILHPVKPATPAVTVRVRPLVQLSVAPAGPAAIASVTTVELSPVSVAPLASLRATIGCVTIGDPPVPLPGSTVKLAYWVTVKELLVAAVGGPTGFGVASIR